MDKDKYVDWADNLETWEIIGFADHWGNKIAAIAAMGGEEMSKLQTFEQYLIEYYNESIVNDGWLGHDDQYDDLKQNGEI